MAAAGGLWDEARWEATEKTEEGKVKVDLLGPLLKYATYNPRRGPSNIQRMLNNGRRSCRSRYRGRS